MFENHLAKYFPNLKIVGEEDTKTQTVKDSEYFKVDESQEINFDFLSQDLFADESLASINVDDLVFFIDPIDATNSFKKKFYTPVTSMIGLTYGETPFIGLLHYFCWEGNVEETKTIFNIPGKGIFEFNLDNQKMKNFELKKNHEIKTSQEALTTIISSSKVPQHILESKV